MSSESPTLYSPWPPWHMATQLPPLASVPSPRHGWCPLRSSEQGLQSSGAPPASPPAPIRVRTPVPSTTQACLCSQLTLL